MPQVQVELTYERDTKNNARFNEGHERGSDIIGRMYLRTAEYIQLGRPERIRVTIEPVQPDAG